MNSSKYLWSTERRSKDDSARMITHAQTELVVVAGVLIAKSCGPQFAWVYRDATPFCSRVVTREYSAPIAAAKLFS